MFVFKRVLNMFFVLSFAVEEMHLSNAQAKKWSLPLPMVTRSSESDSASSSWSARSADEATEDERSPVPSPSASTHSGDGLDPYNIDRHGHHHSNAHSLYTPEASPKSSAKAAEMQSRKLAMKAKQTEEYVQSSTVQQLVFGSAMAAAAMGSGKGGHERDHLPSTHCSSSGGTADYGKCGEMCWSIRLPLLKTNIFLLHGSFGHLGGLGHGREGRLR